MEPDQLFRRLLDTNALAALGYSNYADEVFTSVGMTITANCFKELRSSIDRPDKRRSYTQGAKVACGYISEYQSYPNIALYPVPGSPVYVRNNAGEISIRGALLHHSDMFDTVVTFDDDVGPVLRPIREDGIDYKLVPPNEPLYFLYQKDIINLAEFCNATKRMITTQGWDSAQNKDVFWDFPVNCMGFRQ